MRALAHIETVHNIRPIEGADRIEQIRILNWNLIAKKGEFQEGDRAVYIEIDSLCPSDNEAFSFLESKKYKVKTMKMRGVISQGLALPLSILPEGDYEIGQDVTNILKIQKVEDETEESVRITEPKKQNRFVKRLCRYKWFRKIFLPFLRKKNKPTKGGYPSWVVKTDETRVQNLPFIFENKTPLQASEKLDGSSLGLSLHGKNFYVLSRNCVMDVSGDSNYAKVARQIKAKEVLTALLGKGKFITLQGEMIGEGIQKNKYGIKGLDFYAFNLIIDGVKINSVEARDMLAPYGIKWVPILDEAYILPDSFDDLMEFSTGKSAIADTLREGIVFRDANNTISFKCVSNEFLLKWKL